MIRRPPRSTLFPSPPLFRPPTGATTAGVSMDDLTYLKALNALNGGEVKNYFDVLRSEEHTSELQSQSNLVCRLLLEQKMRMYADPVSMPPSRNVLMPMMTSM